MKKIKIFLSIILLVFLTTGCSFDYRLEIYNNEARENINIDFMTTLPEKPSDYLSKRLAENDGGGMVLFRELKDINNTTVNSKFKKDLSSYSGELVGLATCFDLYKFNETTDEDGNKIISIVTSEGFNCFELYKDLDEVNIEIKSNHKLIETNAQETKNNTYTWKIDKNNSQDTSIVLKLAKDDYVFNYNNEFVKKIIFYGIIIGSVLFVFLIIYSFINGKNKRANRI